MGSDGYQKPKIISMNDVNMYGQGEFVYAGIDFVVVVLVIAVPVAVGVALAVEVALYVQIFVQTVNKKPPNT